MMRIAVTLLLGGLLLAGIINDASAQISDGVIKIGVLSNQSTVGADASGVAAATAARLAVEDFGGAINGVPIEVIDEDFAEKADAAALIARRWFDTEKVDAIADMPVSSAALAVQEDSAKGQKDVVGRRRRHGGFDRQSLLAVHHPLDRQFAVTDVCGGPGRDGKAG